MIELQGMTTTRELLPVFVAEDGSADPELARWLLDRSMSNRREEFGPEPELPPRDDAFDAAVAVADGEAMGRLLDRQTEIEATNGRLLAEERSKRERLYDYRAQAADDKLEANRRILERIRASPEDADRRILPVWEKNVEGAQRMIESIAEERSKRLDELAGRDHVTAQHELLVASFVAIEPDPKPLFDQVRETLTPKMFALVPAALRTRERRRTREATGSARKTPRPADPARSEAPLPDRACHKRRGRAACRAG